jgi:hypothetical protein
MMAILIAKKVIKLTAVIIEAYHCRQPWETGCITESEFPVRPALSYQQMFLPST